MIAATVALAVGLAAQDPAAEVLAKLSLEQKAGQLFVVWSLSRSEGEGDKNNHEKLLAAVRDVGIGGVILSLGKIDDAAALIPKLQAAAKVPLLLAGDFEAGVGFRLDGATSFGSQMLIGATGSARLAEEAGRITGEEAKALGFHWVFAPVLDVNDNPSNPIINVRSFGEDPELVAKMGCAFARGVRSTGLIPCGKHFPGHGNVDTDSHLALATVPGDGAKLRACELLPFQRACKEGLESVMTGHLAVPGLGEEPNVPATLSSKILGGVLRGELGFTGLIVTDALDMGGVKGALPPGEVAVRALLAGADVLLMPPDPLAARTAVVDAVNSGRVPVARLDDAVLRILQAKVKVGLAQPGANPQNPQQLSTPLRAALVRRQDKLVAAEIAARGVTLVRAHGGVLPVVAKEALSVTLDDRELGQRSKGTFDRPVDDMTLYADSSAEDVDAVAAWVAIARTVVLTLNVRVREYSGRLGMPARWQPILDALSDDQQVVVVSCGSPYLAQQLPKADVYVAAYDRSGAPCALAALQGAADFTGRVPVTIPGVAAAGTGLTLLRGTDLRRDEPAAEDLGAALPQTLRSVLEKGVGQHVFPGATCIVARRGAIVADVAVGKLGYGENDDAVQPTTRYDLASLTKVCATTPAVLKLVATSKLSLDDKVGKWVPAFSGGKKDEVTLRHLLAHQGGLRAFVNFHTTLHGKDAIVAAAAAEPLVADPGTRVIYSDLGFMLLMAVVEKASGDDFAAFVQREIWAPLQMSSATFAPTSGAALADAAPTENDPARGGVVRGFVHDENAFAMGGISGHAGAFATAEDVLRLGVAMLSGGRNALPRDVVDLAIHPAGIGTDTTRGVGFQMLASDTWAGTKVPPDCFGHTGFTGTSLWCDPRDDLCVVLLTNRVHPSREGDGIAAVRRAVHDAVLAALR